MSETSFDFRKWILEQKGPYETKELDHDHFALQTQYAIAEINFYNLDDNMEIVEFQIHRQRDDEIRFFLHFEVVEEEHATGLYQEMIDALVAMRLESTIRVVLCCSSALTTSFFAESLNTAAETLHVDYTFRAVSANDIYAQADSADVVLIAPQIGYMEKNIKELMPEQLVLRIPAKIFGSYDAGECISFITEKLEERKLSKQPTETDIVHAMKNDKKVLVIACFGSRKDGNIYSRVYEKGMIVSDEHVLKRRINVRDLEDIINIEVCSKTRRIDVDAICLAIPGIVFGGKVDLPNSREVDLQNGEVNGFGLKDYLEKKYQVPVYLMNNTNVACLGWISKHPQYKNATYISFPRGWKYGGQGTVIDGKMVEGRRAIAGEIKYVENRFSFSDPLNFSPYRPECMLELVSYISLMNIVVNDPEAVVIRCELTPDASAIREYLKKYLPEDNIPDIYCDSDYYECILNGGLAYILQELNH